MNVTVFSLKNEKGLYAFSINKKYIDLFKLQRNMDLFYIHNVKMDKYEFMAFSNNNNSKMLISDVLYDSETNSNIDIITTVEESDSLTESCTYIHNAAIEIEKSCYSYPLKSKYLNIITNLTSIITQPDVRTKTLNIDTFKLFYHLFRNTFSEDADKVRENIF